MRLGNFDHLHDTLREQPIVGMHHLAILTRRRHLSEGNIVVLYHTDKLLISVDTNTGVLLRITFGNLS